MSQRSYRPAALLSAAITLIAALSLLGCSSGTKRELSAEDAFRAIGKATCQELVSLEGDPLSPSKAQGFHCFGEGGGDIAFRWYSDRTTALKVLPDWEALVSEERQLIYTDRWFALGSPGLLEEVFRGYVFEGPTEALPETVPMTSSEQNTVLCASITYNLLIEGATIDDAAPASHEQYFAEYEGLRELVSEVATQVEEQHDKLPLSDYFKMEAVFTSYDDQIKGHCEQLAKMD